MAVIVPSVTLAELALKRPAAVDLLERLQLDYCCGGQRTLQEACSQRGLDAPTVIATIEALGDRSEPGLDAHDVRQASIGELCDHIVRAHHDEARTAMPRIAELLNRVVRVHGGEHGELADLRRVFTGLREELDDHLAVEEDMVFPACRAVEAGGSQASVDDAVLAMCEDSHEFAGEALSAMREVSGGYDPERALCGTHRALLEALHRFEVDLHQHVHEENNVLFPRVRDMAGTQAGS
jgi:regulator of cell morphogenesis and NO signaling